MALTEKYLNRFPALFEFKNMNKRKGFEKVFKFNKSPFICYYIMQVTTYRITVDFVKRFFVVKNADSSMNRLSIKSIQTVTFACTDKLI